MQPKITFNVIRKSVTLHINEGQFNFEAQVDLSHTNGKVSMDVAQSLIWNSRHHYLFGPTAIFPTNLRAYDWAD